MSSVFIPLGGAGGKNRGNIVYLDEDYAYFKSGGSGVALPLPAGTYKALKEVRGEGNLFVSYGDGKNAAVFMTKEFLKKVAIDLFDIASITNFSFAPRGHRQTMFTWAKPSGGAMWSGVRLIAWKKSDSEPRNPDDTSGKWVHDTADTYIVTPLFPDVPHYIKAVSYVSVNGGRWYQDFDSAPTLEFTPTQKSGAITLSTGAGTWTVPDNVYKIRYILVGGGGRGGYSNGYYASGGGGGGYFTTGYKDVTPGQQIPWVVPSSNVIGAENNWNLSVPHLYKTYIAGRTVFGDIFADSGKTAAYVNQGAHDEANDYQGGHGGSGGGGGGTARYTGYTRNGGSNGSDGQGHGGIGQHSSTTGFNGVLYSGGGAGGGIGGNNYCQGGAGGGGSEYPRDRIGDFVNGYNGVDGLGGGGGGCHGMSTHKWSDTEGNPGKGGTGCIYIAWGSAMNDGS